MSSSGQGGSRMGRLRGRAATTHTLTAEELERRRRASDAARIRGSYRYLRPSPAFAWQESRFSRARLAPAAMAESSSHGSTSRSRSPCASSPLALPAPAFAPKDFIDDDELERVIAALPAPAVAADDFVADRDLATVERLVMETSRREADKAGEWRREAEEQERVFVDLDLSPPASPPASTPASSQ